jgi:hypothetical protein
MGNRINLFRPTRAYGRIGLRLGVFIDVLFSAEIRMGKKEFPNTICVLTPGIIPWNLSIRSGTRDEFHADV